MADDLFRSEALKAQSSERWGRPVGLLPIAWSRITLLLTLFVAVVVVFISTASFSRTETVRGRLRPTTVEARVFAREAGVAGKVSVGLGDLVTAGDVLAEIETPRQIDGDTSLSSETLADLIKEKESLEERRKVILQTADLARRRLEIDIQINQSEREGMQQSGDLVRRRLTLAEERFAISERLQAEGAASKDDGRTREEALIAQKQQLIDLTSRIADSEAKEKTDQIDLRRVDV